MEQRLPDHAWAPTPGFPAQPAWGSPRVCVSGKLPEDAACSGPALGDLLRWKKGAELGILRGKEGV